MSADDDDVILGSADSTTYLTYPAGSASIAGAGEWRVATSKRRWSVVSDKVLGFSAHESSQTSTATPNSTIPPTAATTTTHPTATAPTTVTGTLPTINPQDTRPTLNTQPISPPKVTNATLSPETKATLPPEIVSYLAKTTTLRGPSHIRKHFPRTTIPSLPFPFWAAGKSLEPFPLYAEKLRWAAQEGRILYVHAAEEGRKEVGEMTVYLTVFDKVCEVLDWERSDMKAQGLPPLDLLSWKVWTDMVIDKTIDLALSSATKQFPTCWLQDTTKRDNFKTSARDFCRKAVNMNWEEGDSTTGPSDAEREAGNIPEVYIRNYYPRVIDMPKQRKLSAGYDDLPASLNAWEYVDGTPTTAPSLYEVLESRAWMLERFGRENLEEEEQPGHTPSYGFKAWGRQLKETLSTARQSWTSFGWTSRGKETSRQRAKRASRASMDSMATMSVAGHWAVKMGHLNPSQESMLEEDGREVPKETDILPGSELEAGTDTDTAIEKS